MLLSTIAYFQVLLISLWNPLPEKLEAVRMLGNVGPPKHCPQLYG